MNFKAIKRAEELRLNIEKQDREIIELEKVMYSLATQDDQELTLSLSVSSPIPINPGTGHNFKSGGYPVKSIATDYGSLSVFDTSPVGRMSGIFQAMQEIRDNEERIVRKTSSRSSFDISNGIALEFLSLYHKKLLGERALTFKLLEECIKSLQLIN